MTNLYQQCPSRVREEPAETSLEKQHVVVVICEAWQTIQFL